MKNLNITFEDKEFKKLNDTRERLYKKGLKFSSWEKLILYLINYVEEVKE